MKKIVFLTTGGTIAGIENGKNCEYTSGVLSADKLISSVKNKLSDLKNDFIIETHEICSIDSKNMNESIWKKLYLNIQKFLKDHETMGFVITHGTDTLSETAFFLEYTIKTDKPIILTGAMRPATALSADGPDNLFNAFMVAASTTSKNRGVLVVMNNEIHSAIDVIKTHKNNTAAFKSPNMGPVGVVLNSHVQFFTKNGNFEHEIYDFNENITFLYAPIITAYAGDSGELIYSAVKLGAKGIVYAGFGAGTYPDTVKNAMDFAAKLGVKIMIASAPQAGFIENCNKNFLSADFLSPQKARILLMLEICAKEI